MKEVDIIPDDPKSSEHIKQLEQVLLLSFLYLSVPEIVSVVKKMILRPMR